MKCQNLFFGENKKNISICHLLKILPRVLRINNLYTVGLVHTGCGKYRMHNMTLLLVNTNEIL